MENRAHVQLAVGTPEQMTMASAGASATPGETSCFHTALEECLPLGRDVALGDRSGAGSSMEQKLEYFSARVEEMTRSKSQFSSDVEREIEHSRVHWSEVRGLFKRSKDNGHEDEVSRENRKVFEELAIDPQWQHPKHGPFFLPWLGSTWRLGQKIAKGGQAVIFEVIDKDGSVSTDYVMKVFKRGSRLSDLKKQWPTGILRKEVLRYTVFRGTLLVDGRFAFLLMRCWGDLRKLIDQAMQENNNQGPPFSSTWNKKTLNIVTLNVNDILRVIAQDMIRLHEKGIIHRDLKAANVLLQEVDNGMVPAVADYECSIGVVGTGFWRAPEILLALKNGSAPDFNEKVDVYSYGMICYEVVTGRLPFEGELEDCRASRDLVIAGQRPQLPSDLDVILKDLVEQCWNPIPHKRPRFEEIFEVLDALRWNVIVGR